MSEDLDYDEISQEVEISVTGGENFSVTLSAIIKVGNLANYANIKDRLRIQEVANNLLKAIPAETLKSLDDSFCDEELQVKVGKTGKCKLIQKKEK